MKTPPKILFCLLLLARSSQLWADDHNRIEGAYSPTVTSLVTASEYCDFLNHVAVADPHHLYRQAMGSDPETACIARVGAPGRWQYQIIAGRENLPISYVVEAHQASYADWLRGNDAHPLDPFLRVAEADDFLASNKNMFTMEVPAEGLSLLAASSTSATSQASLPTLEKVGEVLGLLGLATFAHELMIKEGNDVSPSDAGEAPPLKTKTPPETANKLTSRGEPSLIRKEPGEKFQAPNRVVKLSEQELALVSPFIEGIKPAWDSFSQAAKSFRENPNDKTLKAAADAAHNAADATHNAADATHDDAYAASDASYAASYAASAPSAARDAARYAVLDAAAAARYASHAARYGSHAAHYAYYDAAHAAHARAAELHWIAKFAQEATDFANAAYKWRFEEKPASLQAAEIGQESLISQTEEMVLPIAEASTKIKDETAMNIQEEMKPSASNSEGSPESHKSSDSSEGASTPERVSDGSSIPYEKRSKWLLLKQEWEAKSARERKKAAFAFQNKASRAENLADEARRNALDAAQEERLTLLEVARQKADRACQAYTEAVEALTVGFGLAQQGGLKADWWEKALKIAKNQQATWKEASSSYEDKKQTDPRLSEEDLRLFPYASLVAFQENPTDDLTQLKRVKILRTMMNDSYVRIEEIVDSSTGSILNRQEMAANHFLVRLRDEEDPQVLLNQLRSHLQLMNLQSIERVTPYTPLYKICFTPSSIEKFLVAALPEILEVSKSFSVDSEPDYLSRLCSFPEERIPNDIRFSEQWGLSSQGINMMDAWKILDCLKTGAPPSRPIIVAVIDTGIYHEHEDLTNSMWTNCLSAEDIAPISLPNGTQASLFDSYDEEDIHAPYHGYNAHGKDTNTMDTDKHGTHCAGIIGAGIDNASGIAGIAPYVRLMACKIPKRSEDSTNEAVLRGVYYACEHGAKILSCSFARNPSEELLKAFQYAQKKGIIVVAAAGNNGTDNDKASKFPANYGIDDGLDNIVSVAATGEDGSLAKFNRRESSNYGKRTVHVAAPGKNILSTGLNPEDDRDNAYYLTLSGTSMAAPHITGALVMMMHQFPHLHYRKLISRLLKKSDKTPKLDGKVRYGRPNLVRALTKGNEAAQDESKELLTLDLNNASDQLAADLQASAINSIMYYKNAKKTFKEGKDNEADSWDSAGDAALKKAKSIKDSIIKNYLTYDQSSWTAWEKAIENYQYATDCFARAATAFQQGNDQEGHENDKVGDAALWIADQITWGTEQAIKKSSYASSMESLYSNSTELDDHDKIRDARHDAEQAWERVQEYSK